MAHPKQAITGSKIIFTSKIQFYKIFYIFIQLSMFLMFHSKFPENHSIFFRIYICSYILHCELQFQTHMLICTDRLNYVHKVFMPLVGTYSKKSVCKQCSLFTAKLLPALKEKRLLLGMLNHWPCLPWSFIIFLGSWTYQPRLTRSPFPVRT